MNRQTFQTYRAKILSIIKLLAENGLLTIPDIDTNHSINLTKENSIMPTDKIK